MMGRALEVAVADLRAGDGERGFGEVVEEGGLDPDTGQGIASSHWHQGAAGAHVSRRRGDGQAHRGAAARRRLRGHGGQPPGAALQNDGSMLMGLGTALFEAIDFGDGQVANANLSDYNVPAPGDVPARFTHEIIERDGAEVHGLGETVLPPVPAAIGNALASLGLDVRELPVHRGARPRRGGRAMSVTVILNGRPTVLDCAPSTMLLDALRDGEGLTSVRATCGIGVCGACTVLLDGEPVTGCLTMAGQAEGRAITTRRGPRRDATPCSARSPPSTPSSAAGARPASCSP